MKHFREFLKTDNRANPFNHQFNILAVKDEWISWLRDYSPEDTDLSKLLATAQSLETFNNVYQEVMKAMAKTISQSELGKDQILQILLAQHNSSHLFVTQKFRSDFQEKDFHFSETFAHQTSSRDPEVGSVNTGSGLATLVDTLQIALNHVIGMSDLPEYPISNDFKGAYYLDHLNKLASIYFAFKTCYESAIWNNGYIKQVSDNKFQVFFADTERMILEEIGRFRLQQDSLASGIKAQQAFEASGPDQQLLEKFSQLKPVRISNVSISSDGYVRYYLANGYDAGNIINMLEDAGTMNTFYPYLENILLPTIASLKITDLLLLFRMMGELFEHVSKVSSGIAVYHTLEEIMATPFRISKTMLRSYLTDRTNYTEIEIDQFMTLVTKPEKQWVNFWNWALLPQGEDYLVPILPVTAPNIFYQIDRWLETGGFNLKRRGKMLEKYAVQILSINLKKQNFQFHIPETNRFRSKDKKQKEEIDLIINLKEILIIAEVKCIRFPMEIRDYHNNYARLTEGAEQVNRKAAFIAKYGDDFKDSIGNVQGKPIVRLVVTNYPIFAGMHILDVPIIDFHWLQGFVKHRQYIRYYTENTQEGLLDSQAVRAETLYHDEDEFNAVFEQQMRKPAFTNMFKPMVTIRENKMSFADFPLDLYIQGASFKN